MQLQCDRFQLELSKPKIMGILNVTPDSFSDGGRFLCADSAVSHALQMVEDGADIIDVGGESTRPGAENISLEAELQRVVPIVETLAKQLNVPISVDTTKPEVMRASIERGAAMINDVTGLQAVGALEVVQTSNVAVCIMHMQAQPRTMQTNPQYGDVVGTVSSFMQAQVAKCEAAGISRKRLLVDPGFGFGKTLAHNLALFKHLSQLAPVGIPVMVGVSRKRMLGEITGQAVHDRGTASVVAAVLAIMNGASVVRVHDVKETRQGLQVAEALNNNHNGVNR